MENKNIEISGKGIRIHVLTGILIAIGVVIMAASILVIRKVYISYDNMRDSYQYTQIEREAALRFQKASDYLTDQARRFATTGDPKYAANYFNEKDIIQNREAALAVINDGNMMELECSLLDNAMKQSEELVVYELHAMKLTAVANGLDMSDVAKELEDYVLTGKELSMDSNEQILLAEQIMYGTEYEGYKERITWDVENATYLIEEDLGAKYRQDEDSLVTTLNLAVLLIFLMFILLVLIFIFTVLLVVKPADRFVEALNDKEKLPEIGSYEFRKFARRYNDVYRAEKRNLELLMEQGEIDELTGTLKVSTLDMVKKKLTQNNEPLGVMMVDIDNFRTIKEKSGYDMADKLVAKVAKLFVKKFKSSDYIIRISSDEFMIFLLRMVPEDAEMLSERIAKINDKLKNPTDDVPAASVSVGVAFSENGYTVDAERKADMALNTVKENGRGNCKIAE